MILRGTPWLWLCGPCCGPVMAKVVVPFDLRSEKQLLSRTRWRPAGLWVSTMQLSRIARVWMAWRQMLRVWNPSCAWSGIGIGATPDEHFVHGHSTDTLVLSRELPRAEGLDFEEIEELVLAHLLAFPDFLADALVMNFLRQVQLGQSFLHAEDQRINVAAVLQQLQPQLEKHKATAAAIAAECCRHLQDRSETLAGKLLSRMDLDNDGFVGEQDFLKSAVHALALEVENVAVSAGVQQLLKDESFADDFHEAMCTALIRNGTVQVEG
ncbi:unnamed protein product [Effrenium voratum]|nr:unnamed protein product [Effrenium voratum]